MTVCRATFEPRPKTQQITTQGFEMSALPAPYLPSSHELIITFPTLSLSKGFIPSGIVSSLAEPPQTQNALRLLGGR
jgi:hypothetical protein